MWRESNFSSRSWFKLTVFEGNTGEHPRTCHEEEHCKLTCPPMSVPPNMSSTDPTWEKPDGKREQLPEIHFQSVKMEDGGVYTCFRSYPYYGQMYNRTCRVKLVVKPKEQKKYAKITEPREKEVFYVDIGSPKVIHCKAAVDLKFDDLFWLSNQSFVETNGSHPVFYNTTWENGDKMTASLVFKRVSENDLTKTYTCKLQSAGQDSSSVNITLSLKARPSYVSLAICSVCVVLAVVVSAVVYAKFKVDVTLFMRDTVGCHRRASDGKSYDIFLMSYKSETEVGINSHDRKMLESVLEDRFGYSLCLFDRDVLPGESIAEAVLDCVERSRTVVLVPTSPDPSLESGLLSALHAAYVERQTRLVFITTERTGALSTGSIPEALQLLSEAGDHVTWKGRGSEMPSSAFWKHLRYHLPAPHHPPKSKISLKTISL
ncbi:interleukin-18 receptor 1-like isoform X2 [Salarias fasciatus]|uniref:interleukin-18 receptor 1-like isoform X2 n=1 Tax=Salarias fasciatus TaxID=181472 RepID=UPI001176E622|nr:interleukin-18 receptor 1-like isoform X2 [Salarias fasciatus]